MLHIQEQHELDAAALKAKQQGTAGQGEADEGGAEPIQPDVPREGEKSKNKKVKERESKNEKEAVDASVKARREARQQDRLEPPVSPPS